MKKLISQANNILTVYYKKIKPSPKEQQSRLKWIKIIKTEIIKIYPLAKVELFGSFYSGLYICSSDIDISINLTTDNPNAVLKAVKIQLFQTKLFHSLLHLSHAKIPILKFKAKKFGYKFDISINNISGIKAGEFVKNKIEKDENLLMYSILFKHFMYSRKLGDGSVGGLNSYSQFLMILNFIEMHPFYDKKNLAVIFFDFVQFYGFDFKYKNVQIDVNNTKFNNNPYKRLSIIDPTDSSVDVGACCKNFEKVIDSLQNFYRLILYHFKNCTITDLLDEMFYISDDEMERRNYVNENANTKLVLEKKKKMSLRDANLFTKSKKSTSVFKKFVKDLTIENSNIENKKRKK